MRIKQPVWIVSCLLLLAIAQYGYGQEHYPKKYRKIQQFLDRATHKLAGVAIYIKSPAHGEWTAVAGYGNINDKQLLRSDDIFSIASIGKMYNAVAVLKLVEEGKIQLDGKISAYLPAEIIDNLPAGKEVTVRQLLNHTSGFVNYENDPELNKLYLSGQIKLDTLSHIRALQKYVFGKAPLCNPGEAYNYSSTNYMLLAMIMDYVLPEGHSIYLRQLLNQHGYKNTWYRQTPPGKGIHYYGDLNQDEKLEDVTLQTQETTNWFIGDDGIYAPVAEAAHFLEDLMKGKILNDQSLKEMTTWNSTRHPDYGLGLMADKSFPYKFLMGHSGRGIGATADLYYFPKQDMTIAIFCNTGLRAAAPGFKKTYNKMRERIIKKLFLF
jgi:D-alanyl-D-alanine carboxypeptidase